MGKGVTKEAKREFGHYMRASREKARLSQQALANRLGIAAEDYRIISQWETGNRTLPEYRLEAWARAVGLDPAAAGRTLLRIYSPLAFNVAYGVHAPAGAGNPERKTKWRKKRTGAQSDGA